MTVSGVVPLVRVMNAEVTRQIEGTRWGDQGFGIKCFGTDAGPLQDRFGTASGPIQDRSGTDLGPIWDRSGTDLGPIWDRSGTDLGPIWDLIWDRSGTDLGPIWDRSGTDLGPIWDRSGTDLGPIWDRSGTDLGPIWGKLGGAAARTGLGGGRWRTGAGGRSSWAAGIRHDCRLWLGWQQTHCGKNPPPTRGLAGNTGRWVTISHVMRGRSKRVNQVCRQAGGTGGDPAMGCNLTGHV